MLHHQHWALTRALLGYPAIVLCRVDPATLGLKDQVLQVLQQIIVDHHHGVDAGMGQLIALVLGWSPCNLSLIPSARVNSPAPPKLVHPMQ